MQQHQKEGHFIQKRLVCGSLLPRMMCAVCPGPGSEGDHPVREATVSKEPLSIERDPESRLED